jgi:LysM repeat protein
LKTKEKSHTQNPLHSSTQIQKVNSNGTVQFSPHSQPARGNSLTEHSNNHSVLDKSGEHKGNQPSSLSWSSTQINRRDPHSIPHVKSKFVSQSHMRSTFRPVCYCWTWYSRKHPMAATVVVLASSPLSHRRCFPLLPTQSSVSVQYLLVDRKIIVEIVQKCET